MRGGRSGGEEFLGLGRILLWEKTFLGAGRNFRGAGFFQHRTFIGACFSLEQNHTQKIHKLG